MAMSWRNPFARTTVVREVVKSACNNHFCSNCGLGNMDGRRILKYYQERDDRGSREPLKGEFCSHDCFLAYHNLSRRDLTG